MYCSSCAAECDQKNKFCPNCGSIISSTGIVFEVNISKLSQTGIVWAITIFSFVGLILSIGWVFVGIYFAKHQGGRVEAFLIFAAITLAFTLLISLSLIWRFGGAAKVTPDAIKQILQNGEKRNRLTIKEVKREEVSKEPNIVPEPLSSVTEQTTRSFDSTLKQ